MSSSKSSPAGDQPTGAQAWFPTLPPITVDASQWRLDVVTLLAVIGESSMAEHSQAITASFLCLLPRILPAPQALLKPARPPRMPETPAKMAGVYSGVVLDTVGFFANIITPLDELPPFAFKAIEIRHKLAPGGAGSDGWIGEKEDRKANGGVGSGLLPRAMTRPTWSTLSNWLPTFGRRSTSGSVGGGILGNDTGSGGGMRGRGGRGGILAPPPIFEEDSKDGRRQVREKETSGGGTPSLGYSRSVAFNVDRDPEYGGLPPMSTSAQPAPAPVPGIKRRRTVQEKVADFVSNPGSLRREAKRPAVPVQLYSPVHVLSFFSFLLTIGLLVAAIQWQDAPAVMAVSLVSLASSVVGYASWWKPILMNLNHSNKVPPGDIVIRTREGAFIYIRCKEEVARELYSGTEECKYRVGERLYRLLMGLGTILLMVSVVLLGNCSWNMQLFIGVSYILLNGLYWAMGMLPQEYFWDLGRYDWHEITPPDAEHAETTKFEDGVDPREGTKSFTRTLWYAIRETKRTGWVERSGAAPGTPQWKQWLSEAEAAARRGDRLWPAVRRKDEIMKGSDERPPSPELTAVDDDDDDPRGGGEVAMDARAGLDADADADADAEGEGADTVADTLGGPRPGVGGRAGTDWAEQHAPLSEVQGRRGSVAPAGSL